MMMRRLGILVVLFGLVTLCLRAQLYQAATWYTTNGGLDTGVVKLQDVVLNKEDGFQYGYLRRQSSGKREFFTAPHQDLEWLVVSGDTLLRVLRHNGQSVVFALRWSGEVSLYSSLEPARDRNYYWREHGRWHELRRHTIRNIGYSIIGQNCRSYARTFSSRRWTDIYLETLTKSLNSCLGSAVKRPLVSWQKPAGEIGLNLWEHSDFSSGGSGSVRANTKYGLGLTYQRTSLAGLAGLSLTAQGRWWSVQRDELFYIRSFFSSNITPAAYQEQLKAKQLYLSAGFRLEPLAHRRSSIFFGLGATAAIPIQFIRKVDRFRSSSLPDGLPNYQYISGGVPVRVGGYVDIGLRYSFTPRYKLLVSTHFEYLKQEWSLPNDIIRSSNFWNTAYFLAPQTVLWQLTLLRSIR